LFIRIGHQTRDSDSGLSTRTSICSSVRPRAARLWETLTEQGIESGKEYFRIEGSSFSGESTLFGFGYIMMEIEGRVEMR
jgi:hypothetical protein